MMIPQVARHLIRIIQEHRPGIRTLVDPFMGSGTSLVEGLLSGLAVTGSDLNPLARLIAFAKTHAWDPLALQRAFKDVVAAYVEIRGLRDHWPSFENLEYWFKPEVIMGLARLKQSILTTVPEDLRPFFWVAFSDTVRSVSNSRNAEFKLYRLAVSKLAAWNPDVLSTFQRIVNRNLNGNAQLWNRRPLPSVSLYSMNAMHLAQLPSASFDLMVTSPPYGDSRTTVAYGQFSRLSLQWLDLPVGPEAPSPTRLDQAMLGGLAAPVLTSTLPSPTLNRALDSIAAADRDRARDVLSFYQDLDHTLSEIARVMRPGSYQCWVVGNRTVKNVRLFTHQIICELSERYGLHHVLTFSRNIPNKRMPKENSPTNQAGQKVSTMTEEKIFILRKE